MAHADLADAVRERTEKNPECPERPFCPGVGWVDFDPTNNVIPTQEHITLAWGRDYDDISPVKGIILGGRNHTMGISVDVAPIG
jgi:transglutaminase-like putative cysteine protease